jgi:hypothetical protein
MAQTMYAHMNKREKNSNKTGGACNPCYSGGGGGGEEEDCGPRPALGLRLYLKNKLKQKG